MNTSRVATLCILITFIVLLGPAFQLANSAAATPLQVVTTFSILQDIVENVGGDRVSVHSMVPLGTDPHEYSPLPLDLRRVADADIVFWNSLNLEVGDDWFHNLLRAAGKSPQTDHVYALTDGIEPLWLTDGTKHQINPHAFLDVTAGMQYAKNARDALIAADPDHAAVYEANATRYLKQLEAMDAKYRTLINEIPPENRILITSERAFQYMARTYGLSEGYVWEIDTEEHGTPRQFLRLINFIKQHKAKIMFLESNVDPRPLERISLETKVPIYKDRVYSDELGRPGSPSATYLQMLDWNINTIYNGLLSP